MTCTTFVLLFQVICFRGICHPVWHEDYLRDIDDRRPVEFNGEGARAIHFTEPKAPPSIASPSAIKTAMLSGTPDIYARFGHLILTKSGRGSIMDEADAQLIWTLVTEWADFHRINTKDFFGMTASPGLNSTDMKLCALETKWVQYRLQRG